MESKEASCFGIIWLLGILQYEDGEPGVLKYNLGEQFRREPMMMMKIVRIRSHTVAKAEMMSDICIILHLPQIQGAAPAGQELAQRPDMQF